MKAMFRQVTICSILAIICFYLIACGQSKLNLEYQKDKKTLVISVDSIVMPVGGEDMCNHIPDLRVWGDGRVVFSQFQPGQKRTVKAGYLDTSHIQSLL